MCGGKQAERSLKCCECYSLSKLATTCIVADFGDILTQKRATVGVFCDSVERALKALLVTMTDGLTLRQRDYGKGHSICALS